MSADQPPAFPPQLTVQRQQWQVGQPLQSRDDVLACEIPVALVYNGLAHVVMMASPQQLEDFARGFTLAEGIARQLADIYDIEVREVASGIEVHVELASACFAALKERRRQLAGRTGCGLCGVEQLAEVFRPLLALPDSVRLGLPALNLALQAMPAQQLLSQATGCAHAAAWLDLEGRLLQVCEDVGRHVALDKLIGCRALSNWGAGAALVTSRASYEMVQKAAAAGIEILVAVAAPTALAVQMAEQYGLTLLGFARPGRVNVYTHPQRLLCQTT
ncbi:formate dehydrogenase chain D [Aquitalea magnusonii]|uniref:Sulfur carrier protein FdhD n=1 Tax=Aquitalea magnusonii TaxID=332411 RepID=A0A3G9G753_9NEIS|nr:formate dehydrogenase accessory sulfurtransferase FdhD [Aquitalea magnusonii]BBF83900.1 formate dehydrogenase chain D [Aquitalea magnusonii]